MSVIIGLARAGGQIANLAVLVIRGSRLNLSEPEGGAASGPRMGGGFGGARAQSP